MIYSPVCQPQRLRTLTSQLTSSQVFALLFFEIILFCLLIVDLPFGWKAKLFTFLAENPLVSKVQYGMKITFIFVAILWIDSINRVYRVHMELQQAKQQGGAAYVLP